MDLRQVFDDLVRFETEVWNTIDARLTDECGVSLGTFNALLVISETPNCRVNDLAAALSITVGGASQAVDRIEARGLLTRVPNPANRRSSLLRLTPRGHASLQTASSTFDRELATLLAAPLTDPERDRFAKSLSTLRAATASRRKEENRP